MAVLWMGISQSSSESFLFPLRINLLFFTTINLRLFNRMLHPSSQSCSIDNIEALLRPGNIIASRAWEERSGERVSNPWLVTVIILLLGNNTSGPECFSIELRNLLSSSLQQCWLAALSPFDVITTSSSSSSSSSSCIFGKFGLIILFRLDNLVC